MPQHQQTLPVSQYNNHQLLLLSYGTFLHLGWTPEFAAKDRLVGYTKKKWGSYYDHILVDTTDENLTVTSQLPEEATWDLLKKNKKNVAKFLFAFEEVKAAATAGQLEEWAVALSALQEKTGLTLQVEEAEAAETEAVMKLSTGSRGVTYTLMGVNVLLFVAMVATGVHFFEPLTGDLLKWGANYKPLTTGGEWWRLLSSTFIHIGIIHLLFNMYALYMVGTYLEPMVGKGRFLAAYFCTGVLASLCSTWWHGNESVSAGASGAVFGLYGVFLALLTTRLIPKSVRKGLLQSIGIFVFYNLAYGAGSQGVDNSAHLGGLLSGLAIGYLYFFTLGSERFRPGLTIAAIVVAAVLLSFTYLRAARNDSGLYAKKIEEVIRIEEKAMEPFNRYTDEAGLLSKLSTVSQVEWAKAKAIMDETGQYQLDTALSNHRQLLKEYIDLRIQYNDLSIISLQGKENVDGELDSLANAINAKVEQMQRK